MIDRTAKYANLLGLPIAMYCAAHFRNNVIDRSGRALRTWFISFISRFEKKNVFLFFLLSTRILKTSLAGNSFGGFILLQLIFIDFDVYVCMYVCT